MGESSWGYNRRDAILAQKQTQTLLSLRCSNLATWLGSNLKVLWILKPLACVVLPLSFPNTFPASCSPFKAYFIHRKLSELNGNLLLILILWGRWGIEIIYFICLRKPKLRKVWNLIWGFTLNGDREIPCVALLRGLLSIFLLQCSICPSYK